MSNARKFKRGLQLSNDVRPGEEIVKGHDYPPPGAVNGYRCDKCNTVTLIRHADTGVTPMFLSCQVEACDGSSHSLGYPKGRIPEQYFPIEWEWYRPNSSDQIMNNPEMVNHVRQGGLALRRI